ncbi:MULTISPECIES: succinate dehydrogenase iron-sulfur subunit [Sorangium]|uniref:succinate dehydrogenase n=1 Tax=Sorangium cellulosum TaxID=56 RepID=A0A4P2R3W3_SORCE|nr:MULTISPECIES: succinate dehydrogenase iron-sulfur subunit [Sorangium]AUX37764.1 succinate dehydrogenase iron-sulfur subunit [Sorangium cellulosum]WCQ97053.1 Fumarate reductase iron-sulfur subunit [Sorangium sp. Soce836]
MAKASGDKANGAAAPAEARGEGRLVHLRVRRQDTADRPETRRWEEFKVPYLPQMNVISALQQIQRDPRTVDGKEVAPVVWEAVCLEEVCGSCTMVINGRVRQACSALVDQIAPKGEVITLEPMSKFPLVRDLLVDRSRMFEDMKRVRAWIDIDGTHELGPGPRESPERQEERYPLSRCMTCGCCVEACPQYNDGTKFVGAFAINLVRLYNMHPSGAMHAGERLESVMGEGGITDCGKSQNCVEVCPKEIPLVDSLATVARDTTKRMLFGWLLK